MRQSTFPQHTTGWSTVRSAISRRTPSLHRGPVWRHGSNRSAAAVVPDQRRRTARRAILGDGIAATLHHIYHDRPCPDCGQYYCRFDTAQVCPFCGSDAAAVYELIDEVFEYARASFVAAGRIALDGYRPISPGDHYLILGFELLEAYRQHVDLEPELVAAAAVEQYAGQFGHHEQVEAHWREFFVQLLTYWREQRNRPL